MPIDWFTVGAQAINFLVLVALLKRFLYGPIVRTVTARAERIADRLAAADEARRRSEREEQELSRMKRDLERRRDEMLEDASEKARARGRDLLEEARQDVLRKETEWLTELERRHARLVDDLTERTNDNLVAALRQILSEFADEALQERMIRVFVGRLGDLDGPEKSELESVLGAPEITISTAFPVSSDQEEALRTALTGVEGAAPTFRFETEPALVCGIEVRAGGRRVSWSFRQAERQTEGVLRASLAPFREARVDA